MGVSIIVDITNYVMLLLGQPMHAFDRQHIHGDITVRLADQEQDFELLDGQTVKIQKETLLIADDKGPLALAGIMGGNHCAVTDGTTEVVLESAFFAPLSIMGKPRSYGLHTDASMRFERGVDPDLAEHAIELATQMVIDLAGGEAGPVIQAVHQAALPQNAEVTLTLAQLSQYLGMEWSVAEVTELLERLQFEIVARTHDSVTVRAPSFRFDISIPQDVIEEVARIYGYHNIPTQLPAAMPLIKPSSESQLHPNQFKQCLVSRGYYEAITYSFIAPKQHQAFFPDQTAIQLSNPISQDMSVMRTSLLPGLSKAVATNLNHQQLTQRLFEVGACFLSSGEEQRIAGVITGEVQEDGWSAHDKVDFYTLKADVEALIALTNPTHHIEWSTETLPSYCHPGRSANIIMAGKVIGVIGQLHPSVAKQMGIKLPLFFFELSWDFIANKTLPVATAVSKFPAIQRDLAVELSVDVMADQLLAVVRSALSRDLLPDVYLSDVYQGENVPEGKKSVALRVILQSSDKTMEDAEVNQEITAIIEAISTQLDAQLRET